jgi:predicted nucleic acid-binding protein
MSAERFTLDTNVLVYAADNTAGARHERALEIVDRAVDCNCILTTQALGEFYAAVTRKNLMPKRDAGALVRDWVELFPIVSASASALLDATQAAQTGRFAFWDAMLLATAREAGCVAALSEDMEGGSRFGSIAILNPFTGGTIPAAVQRLLALG